MSATLSWADVDARWPDASVMWDLEVAPEGWAPRLHGLGHVLLADDPACSQRHDWRDRAACNCRMWSGGHWIKWSGGHWIKSNQSSRFVLEMSSGVNILPNTSAQITGRPQGLAFWPERIVIRGTPGDWIVNDIRIGGRSQFSQSGDVPGETFASTAIDSFAPLEIVQVAMDFVMVITFVGASETGAPFACLVLGRTEG